MADPARPIRVLLVEDSPSDVALTEVVFGQAKTDIQLDEDFNVVGTDD